MGQVKQLDQRINADGYLRLMTAEPLAMNMSNQVTLLRAINYLVQRRNILRARDFSHSNLYEHAHESV